MCRASIERFYFNTDTQQCETFIWGGCPRYGTENNFETKKACEETCMQGECVWGTV